MRLRGGSWNYIAPWWDGSLDFIPSTGIIWSHYAWNRGKTWKKKFTKIGRRPKKKQGINQHMYLYTLNICIYCMYVYIYIYTSYVYIHHIYTCITYVYIYMYCMYVVYMRTCIHACFILSDFILSYLILSYITLHYIHTRDSPPSKPSKWGSLLRSGTYVHSPLLTLEQRPPPRVKAEQIRQGM